jgi:hypothetical protein
MLVKRILLILIALAVGAGVTAAVTFLVGTTPAEYGFAYFFFTALCLAIALGIWLDKFMNTEILPK